MSARVLLGCICAFAMLLAPLAAQALGVGDKAPLFTAESNQGEVTLDQYLGKKNVVLAFYFAINTPA
jgi:peroxiredoxin Q/BCP